MTTSSLLDNRISELEDISRNRAFTDDEIDEFCSLIQKWRERERLESARRKRKLATIGKFIENRL